MKREENGNRKCCIKSLGGISMCVIVGQLHAGLFIVDVGDKKLALATTLPPRNSRLALHHLLLHQLLLLHFLLQLLLSLMFLLELNASARVVPDHRFW